MATKKFMSYDRLKEYDALIKNRIDSGDESVKTYVDTKTSDLASATVVDNKIETHNASTSSHNDIRVLITDLTTKLNNFLNVDDATTDQLSEVLQLIENNKGTLESLTTSKVNISDIIDNLETNDSSKVLSAAQGVAIKSLINALQIELDSHTHELSDITDYVIDTTLSSTSTNPVQNKVLDAEFEAMATAMNILDKDIDTARAEALSQDAVVLAEAQQSAKTYTDTVAYGKADKVHTHAISDVSGLQSALDDKAASSHGTHVSYSTTAPVMDGTASVGSASAVARSDHRHPTDTSRASKTEFDSHDSNTTKHITSTERTNWNAAKNHADSAHAPSNAEKNQNAFSNVKVGSITIAADTATDTLELIGSNVTITPDATNDKITVAVADASTGTKGVVQLTNSTSSTSTTTAATPNSVKSAYDLANTAKTTADNAKTRADDAYALAESKVGSLSDLGITATATELNYVDGVTSNIQTQLDEIKNARADWNQNDSTKLDYIENRPFYTTDPVETVIVEGTVPAGEQIDASSSVDSLILGETYTVIFDGTTYNNLVCEEYSGLPTIGNDLFVFAIDGGMAMLMVRDDSVPHTLKVMASISTVVPLERKYIAEHIDTLAGEKVAGKVYVVDGEQVAAGKGAEVFNDYDTNIASGRYSHAEGVNNIASGSASHAEGYGTKASGSYSHAEGYETTASESRSHAEGWSTEATGQSAHAEGFATHATGQFSHAEGDNAAASGRASHAEGYGTEAVADYSHAEGMNTNASSEYQHVQGKYNVIDEEDKYAHIIGNGTSNSNRKNAHTVDWYGNAWFAGDVYVGGAGQDDQSASRLISEDDVIGIAHGGTGATTAASALTNLGITATAAELNKLDGVTASTTELNYVDGVKSNIQTQLNGKAASSHNHSATNITSGTLSSDRLPTVPIAKGGTGATTAAGALTNLGLTATATELNYVDGVKSNIQTQLNGKYGLVRILTSSDNCNNLTDNGIYYYSTSSVPANAPYANAAIIEVFGADSSSSQKIQRATRYGGAGCCSFRQLLSGTWGEWKEIAIADAVAAASHTHAATDIASGTLSSDRLPTVPVAKGGTGGTTVAAAQSALKLTKSYIYSQTGSNGATSVSGITAYPTAPGVYRVTSTSTKIGIPTNYGCLTIFNGGGYYMHLYADSSSFYYGRTTSLVAPTWHKVVTTDDLKSSGAGMVTEYNSGAISSSSVTITGFNSKIYILTLCGSGGFYTSEIIDYMSIDAAGGTREYEVFFANDKWGTITAAITKTGVKFSVSSDTATSFTFTHVRGLY